MLNSPNFQTVKQFWIYYVLDYNLNSKIRNKLVCVVASYADVQASSLLGLILQDSLSAGCFADCAARQRGLQYAAETHYDPAHPEMGLPLFSLFSSGYRETFPSIYSLFPTECSRSKVYIQKENIKKWRSTDTNISRILFSVDQNFAKTDQHSTKIHGAAFGHQIQLT